MMIHEAKSLHTASLQTPTDFQSQTIREITGALNILLADVFGLYLKTKNFHWHVSGSHFRYYRFLLDEQDNQLLAMTDMIAERVHKIGGRTIPPIARGSLLMLVNEQQR